MKKTHPTGLGDPTIEGKRSLFQPSSQPKEVTTTQQNQKPKEEILIHTSIKLTTNAIKIIKDIQTDHRLKTGKVLPLWRLVCQAIEAYAKSKIKKENEKQT